MVSILILTLNEELNLRQCLQSVAWSDDVVVYDSLSSDRTVEIAGEHGAKVVQRKFDNWSAHQNWAHENIAFKNPWVFYLDADERMTDELRHEVLAISADSSEQRVAFYCGRKNFFMDRWIRHAMPPGMIMRFFKPPKVRFERLVNPTPVIDGPHGYLTHYFLHYNFSKGLAEWFLKHNKYSQFEAMEGIKIRRGLGEGKRPGLADIFQGDGALRRKAIKAVVFRLPERGAMRFIHTWIFSKGFLDGRAGFHYSVMISIYEFWIELKMQELEKTPPSEAAEARQLLSEQIANEIRESDRLAAAWASGQMQGKPPAHPLRRLLGDFLFRGGFLRGGAGWKEARMAAAREYINYLLCGERAAMRTPNKKESTPPI